jgi:hypothetical protein
MFCGGVVAQVAVPTEKPEQAVYVQLAPYISAKPVDLSVMSSVPRGRSTVLGGELLNIDAVRDELTLKVFQQRPMKILFDERTQVYRDGERIALHDLAPAYHASVETVLDGTKVFALSIHILTQPPEGESQGSVLSYNPGKNLLIINDPLSSAATTLTVPLHTLILHEGQSSVFSGPSGVPDLVKGSLISVKFKSNEEGRGVATQIAVLATPGSDFTFSGILSALDLHSGFMTLVDYRDEKSYDIFFDATHLQAAGNLRERDHVRVTAAYNGVRYVAIAVTLE